MDETSQEVTIVSKASASTDEMTELRPSTRNVARSVKSLHSQAEEHKHVEFDDDVILRDVEMCHNIMADETTQIKEYATSVATIAA